MTTQSCTLAQLLPDVAGVPALPVPDLALDGRQVVQGGVFVALAGATRHGLDFLPQALASGAATVLWEPAPGVAPPSLPPQVSVLAVPGLRARLGAMADRVHGEPSAQLAVTGITGTNGKTTCAWLLAQALESLGAHCAYAGTLGWGFPPAGREVLLSAALTRSAYLCKYHACLCATRNTRKQTTAIRRNAVRPCAASSARARWAGRRIWCGCCARKATRSRSRA